MLVQNADGLLGKLLGIRYKGLVSSNLHLWDRKREQKELIAAGTIARGDIRYETTLSTRSPWHERVGN